MDLIDAFHQLDVDIFRELNRAGDIGLLDAAMVAFTVIGMVYVIVLVAVPMWMAGKREAAFDVLVLVVVVTIVTEILKLLVDRPRPYLELSGVRTIWSATGPSFPSAHASRAFAVAYLVASNSRPVWGITGAIVASMVALSRVYLGVHWPSDVLAGILLGILIALLMAYIARRCDSYRAVRRRVIGRIGSILAGAHSSKRSASERAVDA